MTTNAGSDWGPFSLAGKRAVVTGAGKGIGLAIVRRYLEAGASVVLTDHRAATVEQAIAGLGGESAQLRGAVVDVTDERAGEQLVAAALDAFGGIDVLVNNAGIYPYRPMLESTRELFERVLAVNVTGLAFCSQSAARRMIAQESGGSIVNIGSTNSFQSLMVGFAAYDASKGAVTSFTRALALELAPSGIRVNEIAAGAVDTPGAARMQEELRRTAPRDAEGHRAPAAIRIPLGRAGDPDDVATVAVFLASDASRYMTGASIPVDGGALIG